VLITPGVAEGKNRHLLDIARSLMIHIHILKCFWADAVLTTNCHLVNVLVGKISFSVLYPDK